MKRRSGKKVKKIKKVKKVPRKKVRRTVKVKVPRMGLVEGVGNALKGFAHKAVGKTVNHVGTKIKGRLPKFLHGAVDKLGNATQMFGERQATKQIDGGVAQVRGFVNRK